MNDEISRGQRTLAVMRSECGYDEMEDTGVDSLIEYKNALEDRLAGLLDGGQPDSDDELLLCRTMGSNVRIRRLDWRELLALMQEGDGALILRRRIEVLLGDRMLGEVEAERRVEASPAPAYTVLGRHGDDQTYIATVYTHEVSGVPVLARRACAEESENPSDEQGLEILAIFEGEPDVVAGGDEVKL